MSNSNDKELCEMKSLKENKIILKIAARTKRKSTN